MDASQRVRAIVSFIHVADAGSFAAGARSLGISAAAVSKNIAGLEAALGLRLMNRSTRTLSLTDEGQAYLRQARIALEALDAAAEVARAHRATPTGKVRISTSMGFGREHLVPALPTLLQRHPGLTVEVDFEDRLVDLIQDGYDLALRGGHIADSSLVARTVCHFHLVLVAAPDYLARHGIPRSPADLGSHRLLTRRFLGGRLQDWRFRTADGQLRALDTDGAAMTLSSPEALTDAAVAAAGIAEVGLHQAWRHLQAGRLKLLLPDTHDPGRFEMTLQYPHRALLAPRVRVTVDHLMEHFAQQEELHVSPAVLPAYAA